MHGVAGQWVPIAPALATRRCHAYFVMISGPIINVGSQVETHGM